MVPDVDGLKRVASSLQAQLPNTSLYRWVDTPLLSVDRAASVAFMHLYSDWSPGQELEWAKALVATGEVQSVYVKRRPKEAHTRANTELASLSPAEPVWGPACDVVVATELGLKFEIRPGNGLSVGCYVDSRDARAWVQANASGLTVLNLFAYTCGFGLAALAGGASRVLNVDLSRKVLEWGKANALLNGFAAAPHDFVAGDTFEWLFRLEKKGIRFDLVILDPPGFATAGKRRFSAVRDYGSLAHEASRLVSPKGRLLALCNVESLTETSFDAQLRRALVPQWRHEASFGASRLDCPTAALKCRVWRAS
jgi:23S rRNA (cytosine1962-C5)-methyltransferase